MSEWYYCLQNDQKGPIPSSALQELFVSNTLPPDTLVWKDGMDSWTPATQVPAFFFSRTAGLVAEPIEATDTAETVSLPKVNEGSSVSALAKTKLGELKVPLWVKLGAVFVLTVCIYSSVALPRELAAAFYYNRGQQAETQRDYEKASNYYKLSLGYCNRSPVILGRLGVVSVYRSDEATVDSVMKQLSQVGPADNGDIMTARIEILTAQKGKKP